MIMLLLYILNYTYTSDGLLNWLGWKCALHTL